MKSTVLLKMVAAQKVFRSELVLLKLVWKNNYRWVSSLKKTTHKMLIEFVQFMLKKILHMIFTTELQLNINHSFY